HYVELGATASDPEDGDLTPQILIDDAAVDTGTPRDYTVTYSVTDSHGNPASADRTVTVTPNNPPSITLNGDNPQLILQGTAYVELGASANDPEDGDLTPQILI